MSQLCSFSIPVSVTKSENLKKIVQISIFYWDIEEAAIPKAKQITVWNTFFYFAEVQRCLCRQSRHFGMSPSLEIHDIFSSPTEIDVFSPFTLHPPACRHEVSTWLVFEAVYSVLPTPKSVWGECSEGSLKLVERKEKENNLDSCSHQFFFPSTSTIHIKHLTTKKWWLLGALCFCRGIVILGKFFKIGSFFKISNEEPK